MATALRHMQTQLASSSRASSRPSSLPYRISGRRPRLAPQRVASIERTAQTAFQRPQTGVDPLTAGWSTEEWYPGQIWTMHSPEQLDAAVTAHSDKLCVLMCKSKTCRPCKMFMKKYMHIAESFPEVVLLQMFGDESQETRKLMVSMKVKVTPTFQLYRGGERAATVTGVSEVKLLRGIVDRMTADELAPHAEDLLELEVAERELAEQEAAEAKVASH